MSVRLVGNTPRYTGTSVDQKPSGVPEGARLAERDTGREYEYVEGRWVQLVKAGELGTAAVESTLEYLLRLLLAETRKVRVGIEHLAGTTIEDPGE